MDFFWSYKVDSALSQENPCWELARYLIFRLKTTTMDIIVCMYEVQIKGIDQPVR